jgi:hypothetical protein
MLSEGVLGMTVIFRSPTLIYSDVYHQGEETNLPQTVGLFFCPWP